jgi:hypothetical protein
MKIQVTIRTAVTVLVLAAAIVCLGAAIVLAQQASDVPPRGLNSSQVPSAANMPPQSGQPALTADQCSRTRDKVTRDSNLGTILAPSIAYCDAHFPAAAGNNPTPAGVASSETGVKVGTAQPDASLPIQDNARSGVTSHETPAKKAATDK